MSVAKWFKSFCDNLIISSEERSSIGNRFGLITRRLNLEYYNNDSKTNHSRYVGSYGRGTAIKGFSDMDMIFQLPYSVYKRFDDYNGNGQSALLQEVRQAIIKTYSTTNIGADGQVVQVPFDDGITFEVVPGFINKDDRSYTHPNANNGGSWKTTDPRSEIAAISTRNNDCNGNLVPLCRMMRSWKNKWDVPIGGLLIDTLAYQFIENWEYRDKSTLYYDYMCRDFFKWMSDHDSEQSYWRAPGSGQYVYGKGLFQYKAKRCYNISLEAIKHETATPKREYSAKQKWREIFGTTYPA